MRSDWTPWTSDYPWSLCGIRKQVKRLVQSWWRKSWLCSRSIDSLDKKDHILYAMKRYVYLFIHSAMLCYWECQIPEGRWSYILRNAPFKHFWNYTPTSKRSLDPGLPITVLLILFTTFPWCEELLSICVYIQIESW